ncbi:MAG: nucleotide pyrophosphohydrolase [Planctomycetes bacterium]|nr:nucleotide pyrophosphohydrolase [Planctomycetota bacterium]
MKDKSTTIRELRNLVAEFIRERDWEQFHDPKNLAMSIAIEAAELMEHFQWDRNEQIPAILEDPGRRKEIEEELADVVCYCLSLANNLEIDLSEAVERKVLKNAEKYPPGEYRGRHS